MIKFLFYLGVILGMNVFCVLLPYYGYKNGDFDLCFVGLGLPVCFWMLFRWLKFLNRFEVKNDSIRVSNIFFTASDINKSEIVSWTASYINRTGMYVLVIKTKKKTYPFSDMIDERGFHKAVEYCRIKLKNKENI